MFDQRTTLREKNSSYFAVVYLKKADKNREVQVGVPPVV